jgi:hypothetical protein
MFCKLSSSVALMGRYDPTRPSTRLLSWNHWCFLGTPFALSPMNGKSDGRNTGSQVESFGSRNVSCEKSGVRFPCIPVTVNGRGLMIARHVTYISKLTLHPSKVLEVQIKKENINPKAGQYIFISCPEISYLQYHPFTLTSAPEEDYVSVHMRIVGDWTSVRPFSSSSNYRSFPSFLSLLFIFIHVFLDLALCLLFGYPDS